MTTLIISRGMSTKRRKGESIKAHIERHEEAAN